MYAHTPGSSQALALSAFVPLLEFADKNELLEEFVTGALATVPPRAGRVWEVAPECSDRVLLGESGRGEATTIDVLLVADDAVVCVECKFRADARQGWGRCSQPPRLCHGFHGPGSDRKGTSAYCRLEAADGHRGPRRYWHAAAGLFRDEILVPQSLGDVCPFFEDYQLVRNYLFAARHAECTGRAWFGVIGLVPEAGSARVALGVERFRLSTVRPEGSARVALATYERYLDVLACGSPDARRLAVFLRAILGRPPSGDQPDCKSAARSEE